MIISNITPPQVWSASSRSLTNFGSGALASLSVAQTSLAGAATLDIRTSAGIVAFTTVSVLTNAAAAASIVIQHWDGTNAQQLAVTAASASSPAAFTAINLSATGLRLTNQDATHAGTYMQSSIAMTI